MSQLHPFRRQLRLLRLSRLAAGWWTALAGLLSVVLVGLLLVFVMDVLLLEPMYRQRWAPRWMVLLAVAAAVAWIAGRYLLPPLRRSETLLETALRIERQFGIRSDLVAALQFESAGAGRWGSTELEQAVIERAARQARGLNVFAGFPWRRPAIAGGLLLAAGMPWLVLAAVLPMHVSVFANRMCLGMRHYPTGTRLEGATINDAVVLDVQEDAVAVRSVRVAQGMPLRFQVRASGRLPATGRVRLTAAGGARQRDVELRRVELPGGSSTGESAVYEGRWNRLVEAVSFQLELGDAWTDPGQIQMIPLPLVALQWSLEPPAYARDAGASAGQGGPAGVDQRPAGYRQTLADARELLVPEGSQVGLRVEAAGGKPLVAVWLELDGSQARQRIDLVAADVQGLAWSLPRTPTPLHRVQEDLRFELQLRDGDGLSLETPIRGRIGIRRDRPPSATADVVHRVVLPTARPVVEYRLLDDYAIGSARLRLQLQRGQDPQSDAAGSEAVEETSIPLALGSLPVTGGRLPLAGRQAIALEGLSPRKGDRLKISLEVTDYRGEREGETYLADPLYLEIADASAVLDEISKADERSEERLSEILKRQLGIGDSP